MARAAARLFLLAVTVGSLQACSTVGGTAPPAPRTGPPVREAEPTLEAAEQGDGNDAARITSGVVEIAIESIGTPYVWGGTNANGFDCSGLIQYAYGQFGILLPRVSTAQMRAGTPVGLDSAPLRPGDILGFSLDDPDKTSHVGLYVGDDQFIHSSSSGVRISNIANPYWQEHLVAARRMVQ